MSGACKIRQETNKYTGRNSLRANDCKIEKQNIRLMQCNARQGKARQGKARQGKARQDKTRQSKAKRGKAGQGVMS